MQLVEFTPALQRHFQSPWELVVMVVLWLGRPGSDLVRATVVHTGLSKLSKMLSTLLLPYVCFILLLHPLSLPKLFGIMSELGSLCKPFILSLVVFSQSGTTS